ncbi:MAG: thioredoxin domain-containing protein, partial [Methylotetracoccus sp.]|nr:thioredoxin domain-containing protein [Methylotetracoccus sp.]
TSSDHEALIHRPKPLMDDSLPSGNGVAAAALWRLGALIGDLRYVNAAERALNAAVPAVQRYPEAHGALLDAIQQYLDPPYLLLLRGEAGDLAEWRDGVRWVTNGLTFAIPSGARSLPGQLDQRQPKPNGEPVAYLCLGRQSPIETLDALHAALNAQ